MPSQHIIEQGSAHREPEQEGIVVPLDLGALRILKQQIQADGSIEVEVIATTDRAQCTHGHRWCVKVHDTRLRRKRDLPHARIVADLFHVIQHVGKALKKVIGRHAKREEGKQALEGQRHLFLRNQEDLSAEEEQTRTT